MMSAVHALIRMTKARMTQIHKVRPLEAVFFGAVPAYVKAVRVIIADDIRSIGSKVDTLDGIRTHLPTWVLDKLHAVIHTVEGVVAQ